MINLNRIFNRNHMILMGNTVKSRCLMTLKMKIIARKNKIREAQSQTSHRLTSSSIVVKFLNKASKKGSNLASRFKMIFRR